MRLLLCEDEEELSNALVAMLKHNNYSVDAVYDGEEALSYLETENYDGVILDIMMPKVDGITVLKTIRSKGNNVPVLMLTAKSEIDDKVLGLDSGADDYLTKPFVTKELVSRICAITRRKTEITDSVLDFENITLDRLKFELKSEKGSVRLSNKEFQMLERLMTNPLNDADRIKEKIREGESKVIEFKETLSLDVKQHIKAKYIVESVLKTVVAFLNTEGGTLLIGVDDNGEILGVEDEIKTIFSKYKGEINSKAKDDFKLFWKNLLKEHVGEEFYGYIEWELLPV